MAPPEKMDAASKDGASPLHVFYCGASSTPNPLAAFEAEDAAVAGGEAMVSLSSYLQIAEPPPTAVPSPSPCGVPDPMSASAWIRGGRTLTAIGLNTTRAMSPLASPLLSPLLSPTPMAMQINDEDNMDENNMNDDDSVRTSESVMEKLEIAFSSTNDLHNLMNQPVLGEEPLEVDNEYEPPTNRQRRRSNTIHWYKSTSVSLEKSDKLSQNLTQSLGSQEMTSAASAVSNGRFSPSRSSTRPSKPSRIAASTSAPPLGGLHRAVHAGGISYSDSAGSLHSEDTVGTMSPPMFIGGTGLGLGGGGAVGTRKTAACGIQANMNGVAAASITNPVTHATFATTTATTKPKSTDKRNRRLERNRESARVSRRRRKHYLEELESRVSGLSEEMDQGRMAHASAAIRTVRGMRMEVLDDAVGKLSGRNVGGDDAGPPLVKKSLGIYHNVVVTAPPPSLSQSAITAVAVASPSSLDNAVHGLITHLSRASTELQVVQTFMKQHLMSLVQPSSTRFILWLTLQDDGFYRGGRSVSERLSAARIGERLLNGGTDRVSPNTTMMWPLVCHEISISYEQEEKVRSIQRNILANSDGWIKRHTALATRKSIEGVYDVVCGSQAAARDRERSLMRTLSPEQSVTFMVWARGRANVIKRLAEKNARKGRGDTGSCDEITGDCSDGEYKTSSDRHISANLYIINHLLAKVMQRQQQQQRSATAEPTVSVPPTKLKKLSRRPSYESLAGLQAAEDAANAKKLSREGSFSSAGSLKRCLASMTSLGDDSNTDSNIDLSVMSSNAMTLESAQTAGQAAVMSVLRDVLPVVPKEAWCHPASGATVHPPTMVKFQSLPLPQVVRKPKSSQQSQQPQKWKPQQVYSSGISSPQQQSQPSLFDIPGVDDIPMPTPVSVLLHTSDDYFVSSPSYEQQESLDAFTSSGFTSSAADNFSMPIGYSSYTNANAGINSHRSAPQLEVFAQSNDSGCPSLLASQKMASIPEMDVVMSHTTVATLDHGAADFALPEQINSTPSHIANACQLGFRHQSAPQFDSVSIAMMPEIAYTVPGGIDPIGEFAMLEGMNFSSQSLPNMDADEWAIGEGFDMDVEGSPLG